MNTVFVTVINLVETHFSVDMKPANCSDALATRASNMKAPGSSSGGRTVLFRAEDTACIVARK